LTSAVAVIVIVIATDDGEEECQKIDAGKLHKKRGRVRSAAKHTQMEYGCKRK
jgi:hypothetical protein